MTDENQKKGSRVRIPLGDAVNTIYYGSLYGRGPRSRLAQKRVEDILAKYGATPKDLKAKIKADDYRIVRRRHGNETS
jgi:hypothetical protein